MRLTKLSLLLGVLAAFAVAAGCASEVGGDTAALKQQLCTEADLGGGYIDKTSGDISVQNLADLASDSSARSKQLKSAGMVGGRFAYWVHTVPDPPFIPPLEVVCQALQFHSPTEAAAYVRNIKPTPDDLASSGLTWLADSHRKVEELFFSQQGDGPVRRTFKLTASGNDVDFTIYAEVMADGEFVRTVYVGQNAGGPAVTANDAGKISVAIGNRLHH